MGKVNGKIYGMILLAFAWLLPLAAEANDDSGFSVFIKNYVLPQFNKEGDKLQFIVYGDFAHNLGNNVDLVEPILAMVKNEKYDMDLFQPLNGVRPYSLTATQEEIDKFWGDKTQLQAIISSGAAVFEKDKEILRGDGEAFFRSPELDVNGVGFDAYQDRKFIKIRSEVKGVLRIGETEQNETDNESISGSLNEKDVTK